MGVAVGNERRERNGDELGDHGDAMGMQWGNNAKGGTIVNNAMGDHGLKSVDTM